MLYSLCNFCFLSYSDGLWNYCSIRPTFIIQQTSNIFHGSGHEVLTSNGFWNVSSYPHICCFVQRQAKGWRDVCFFFSEPPEWSKPVQLGRCRELSRKWLVCDTKVRGVTCISVGRYDWPAGDLSSKKTFAFTVLCPQNQVVSFHPMPLTYWLLIMHSSILLFCGLWFHADLPFSLFSAYQNACKFLIWIIILFLFSFCNK